MTKPRPLAVIRNSAQTALHFQSHCVQFSSVHKVFKVHKVNPGLPVAFAVSTARAWPLLPVDHGPERPEQPCKRLLPNPPSDDNDILW